MKLLTYSSLAAIWLAAASPAFADVQVTINNGLVSVVAKDATVRQILTEWARVGQAKIVNVDRIAGGPISIELKNVTEEHALDVLLRSVSGYVAAPREAVAANLSRFDRVFVLATSAPPRQTASAPPAAFPQPQFPQPQLTPPPFAQQVPEEEIDEDRPLPNGGGPPQNPRAPVFNAFPQPQIINPQTGQVMLPNGLPLIPQQPQQAQPAQPNIFIPGQTPTPPPAGYPTVPFGGVAVPGMVAPTPQQPGQIGVPPGQIVPPGQQPPRRPGSNQ